MPRSLGALAALLLLLSASCERRHEADARAMAARVFQGVLVYPRSGVVNVAAGTNAAQVDLSAPDSADRVATWYRQVLRLNGWDLKSDAAGNAGAVTIYAEKGNRPLWITVSPNVGASGSTVSLVGAEVQGDTIR